MISLTIHHIFPKKVEHIVVNERTVFLPVRVIDDYVQVAEFLAYATEYITVERTQLDTGGVYCILDTTVTDLNTFCEVMRSFCVE
jgi:hypothetical protein